MPETFEGVTASPAGWSYKAAAMLAELGASSSERFQVTMVTRIPVSERRHALAHVPLDQERVRIEHLEGDYAVVGLLESIGLERFDSIVFLASAGMRTSEEADARTVLGYVLLKSRLAKLVKQPQILVELLDPANGKILSESEDVMFVSSSILSHLVAHVCLRPELNSVYSALFVAGGAEIKLRSAGELGLDGRALSFAEVEEEAGRRGEIGLGLLAEGNGRGKRLQLNPNPQSRWTLGPTDGIVVLANSRARSGADCHRSHGSSLASAPTSLTQP
jgi:hypothetical protein